MADGKNDARALRFLEITSDSRTLKTHIDSYVQKFPVPSGVEGTEPGYALLKRCAAEIQRVMRMSPPEDKPGSISNSENQKLVLQRLVVTASCVRFQAHELYLKSAAAGRWVSFRQQVLNSGPPDTQPEMRRKVDERLRQELATITEQYVYNNLRSADQRNGYWLDEEPSLAQILAIGRSLR